MGDFLQWMFEDSWRLMGAHWAHRIPPQDAYNQGAASLGAVAAEARSSVAAALAERCVGALKQLRGIVATFRMSNKAEPTRYADV